MVVGKAAPLLVRIMQPSTPSLTLTIKWHVFFFFFALDICVFVLWILVVFGIDKAMLNSSFRVRVFFLKDLIYFLLLCLWIVQPFLQDRKYTYYILTLSPNIPF